VLSPPVFGPSGFVDGAVGEQEIEGDLVSVFNPQVGDDLIEVVGAEILLLEFAEEALIDQQGDEEEQKPRAKVANEGDRLLGQIGLETHNEQRVGVDVGVSVSLVDAEADAVASALDHLVVGEGSRRGDQLGEGAHCLRLAHEAWEAPWVLDLNDGHTLEVGLFVQIGCNKGQLDLNGHQLG